MNKPWNSYSRRFVQFAVKRQKPRITLIYANAEGDLGLAKKGLQRNETTVEFLFVEIREIRGSKPRGKSMGQDDSLPLQVRVVTKIYQQPELHPRCFEVVEHLGTMLVGEFLDRLQLDDDLIVTYQIRNVGVAQGLPAVGKGQLSLRIKRYAEVLQFDLHAILIDRFHETVALVIIHGKATTDDLECLVPIQ